MSSRELSPEWVLSSFIPPIAAPQHEISELIVVAKRLWPSVQAHAYREQPGKSSDEALAFASEVWEGVLRSVAKTIQRSNGRNWRIKNMETAAAEVQSPPFLSVFAAGWHSHEPHRDGVSPGIACRSALLRVDASATDRAPER